MDFGGYTAAIRRWEQVIGRPVPAPTITGRHGGAVLSPLFVEWMMGYPAGHATDVPGMTRADLLHVLGNSVVPQQGTAALRWLLPRLRDMLR